MSTTYTNDSRIQSGQNHLATQSSGSVGTRTLVTAAAAAVVAGTAVGLIAFGFDRSGPEPATSTVVIPGYSGNPAIPQIESAPNVAVPPSNSPHNPVILKVPPAVRSGGPADLPAPAPAPRQSPVPAPAPQLPPAQSPAPAPIPLPFPIPAPGNQDPAPKQDPPKQDPAPKQDPPKQDPAPNPQNPGPPLEPAPKLPPDIYEKPGPPLEPAPQLPPDIYTNPDEPAPGQLPDVELPCIPGTPC